MATMSLSLPDQMNDASDYVRDLICRDQGQRQAIAEIQQAIDESMASGEPQAFDFDSFEARMRGRRSPYAGAAWRSSVSPVSVCGRRKGPISSKFGAKQLKNCRLPGRPLS